MWYLSPRADFPTSPLTLERGDTPRYLESDDFFSDWYTALELPLDLSRDEVCEWLQSAYDEEFSDNFELEYEQIQTILEWHDYHCAGKDD